MIATMLKATGRKDLNIAKEVFAIQQSITGTSIHRVEILETPSKGEVLEGLKASNMVYFACHGRPDSMDPLNSGLFLQGRL